MSAEMNKMHAEHIFNAYKEYVAINEIVLNQSDINFLQQQINNIRIVAHKSLHKHYIFKHPHIHTDTNINPDLLNIVKQTILIAVDTDNIKQPIVSIKFFQLNLHEHSIPIEYEIFVYQQDQFEGCHIRHEKLARGGIRLHTGDKSLYRKICCELATTQQCKNSMISLGGSKGVFVSFNNDPLLCYQGFVAGLLQALNTRDKNLFLGADIGTSSYSDYAVQIAKKHEYNLAEILASGSSTGFHHKNLGITAKGALTVLKHHLRNHDKKCYNVVAIGSMQGDVFANFFRLADAYNLNLNLVAAIGSHYIYLNPYNDCKSSSWLYKQNVSWDKIKTDSNYDQYIFNRHDKTITLEQHVTDFFEIKNEPITPNQLIKSLLAYKCDIWFHGGADTWIAKQPQDYQIKPQDLKALYIVEGGNLGVNMDARKLLLARSYGDYIDNSAGVRLSDYEVKYRYYLQAYHKLPQSEIDKIMRSIQDSIVNCLLDDLKQDLQFIDHLASWSAEDMSSLVNVLNMYKNHLKPLSIVIDYTQLGTPSAYYASLRLLFRLIWNNPINFDHKQHVQYLNQYFKLLSPHNNDSKQIFYDKQLMGISGQLYAHQHMQKLSLKPKMLTGFLLDQFHTIYNS